MTKIAINTDWGGFSLSIEALKYLGIKPSKREDGSDYWAHWHFNDDDRANPMLIQAIEVLSPAVCNGPGADIKVVEIPDDVDWEIHDYDGRETIHEIHQTWC